MNKKINIKCLLCLILVMTLLLQFVGCTPVMKLSFYNLPSKEIKTNLNNCSNSSIVSPSAYYMFEYVFYDLIRIYAVDTKEKKCIFDNSKGEFFLWLFSSGCVIDDCYWYLVYKDSGAARIYKYDYNSDKTTLMHEFAKGFPHIIDWTVINGDDIAFVTGNNDIDNRIYSLYFCNQEDMAVCICDDVLDYGVKGDKVYYMTEIDGEQTVDVYEYDTVNDENTFFDSFDSSEIGLSDFLFCYDFTGEKFVFSDLNNNDVYVYDLNNGELSTYEMLAEYPSFIGAFYEYAFWEVFEEDSKETTFYRMNLSNGSSEEMCKYQGTEFYDLYVVSDEMLIGEKLSALSSEVYAIIYGSEPELLYSY